MFDEQASRLLPPLAERCHVWLVDSEENTKAAQDYWKRSNLGEQGLAPGVTTFARKAEFPEEALDSVLELVEDHHGEWAQDPPVDEVLVVGLPSTDAVLEVLREWGFTEAQSSAEGVTGRRG